MRTVALIRAEEFARVAPVLGPCELVRGEIITMSPGGVRHSEVTARVTFLLERQNQASQSGRVLGGEAGMLVSRDPDTVRGADVAFISFDRLPPTEAPSGFLTVPPELAVEILGDDTSWGDLDRKVAEYHVFGVDVVWVVDPRMHAVRVCPRGGAPFVLAGDAELESGHPAGFRSRVAGLFD